MAITWKANAVNQIIKGTTLFNVEDNLEYIGLILKGRVEVLSDGVRATLGSGSFIGVTDVYMGRYLGNYKALDDLIVYAYPVKNSGSISQILRVNKDYYGLMIASLLRYLAELVKAKQSLVKCTKEVYQFQKENYQKCKNIAQLSGVTWTQLVQIETIKPYEAEFNVEEEQLRYYLECSRIPLEVQKNYFSYSEFIALRQVQEISGLVAQIMVDCMELSEYIEGISSSLISNTDQNLFKAETMLVLELKKNKKPVDELLEIVDKTIDKINQIETIFEENVGRGLLINREKMEQLYMAVLTGEDIHLKEQEELEQHLEEEEIRAQELKLLKNSLNQILEVGQLEKEKEIQLKNAVEYLLAAPDRMSQSDEMRKKKREIATVFYDLYYNVFLYSKTVDSVPKAVDLFLNFGYIDERLLTEAQIRMLCQIKEEEDCGPCDIYTIKEWLDAIYNGKKEPSKNEFDEDYTALIRTRKRQGELTDADEKRLLSDGKEKLRFEIKNMFAYNNRIVNGQPSTYTPILYKEMILREMNTSFLSKQRINESIKKLLTIDYSIFYREVVYSRPDLKIDKEYIMKEIFPDIILMPMVGINASMWQEISGKRRDSAGRFIFPHFLEGNIDDLMLKLFGRFHWELCRSVQGAGWNDIKYKSLTSEYTDYLQFYRKNHNLSEEKKEKLKLQIQRGRNNSREVFLIDYEAWMKGEVNGSMRLNKIVREFLATYVPFSKPIREKLKGQPMFQEAMARYYREKAKKVHELEIRFRSLAKDNVTLTKELLDTMRFYKEL